MTKMLENLRNNVLARITVCFFCILTVWWVTIFIRGLTSGVENDGFTLFYPWLSLFGGIIGLISAKKWGGFKSYLGLAITFLSFGLLAQFFGQAMYAYYIYVKSVEVPYPSTGDIGYFGSVILYIVAVFYLAKVSGAHISLKSYRGALLALLIPVILLGGSYYVFLRDYASEGDYWLKTALDFAYPLGQAVYVSLALLAFFLSRKVLGGLMRKPILFLIFALVVQYLSDFTFLYQANQGSWYVGGINDFMYLTSYALMTLALIYIGGIFNTIQQEE